MTTPPETTPDATPQNVTEGALGALRDDAIRLLTDLAATLNGMGDRAEADRQRLLEVAQDLREAFFLVVIIGEFNAGKSSFINALLGERLLPIGITPTTEAIELIRYSEIATPTPKLRDDGIREWYHPNTGGEGIALVDTPGTGSVFQRHEDTAKAFMHRSDLVIFLISAKRALAETERLYLELAQYYGKKVILVVNQSDLLSQAELSEVRRFVERQVEDLLKIKPLLFMVSARDAINAIGENGDPNSDPGNMNAVRAHLRGLFNQAPPARQKLLSQLDMAQQVVSRYVSVVEIDFNQVKTDTNKVRDVQSELERQAQGLDKQLKGARADVDRVFDGLRQRGHAFIDANLSIRRIGRGLDKAKLQQEFEQVVIGRALRDINEASSDYINTLIDNSRLYWRGVIDRLNQLQDLLEQELAGLDASVYAEQRENLQEAIDIAEDELKTYSTGQVLNTLQTNFQTNMNGFVTSGLAAIGGTLIAVLAIAAPGPVIGAGAAALALPALIIGAPIAAVGGAAALRYYRRVTADAHKELDERIDTLQKSFHDSLDSLTSKERSRLTSYGRQVLQPVFSRLDVLADRYERQQDELRQHRAAIDELRKRLEA